MKKLIFYLASILISFPSLANDNTTWSSFGTLGLTFSDSNRYGYRKDISTNEGVFSGDIDWKNNSVLGLQIESTLSENIDFVGQAVLRELVDPSLEQYFTLGFLRYTPSVNWSFRFGRVSPDIFLITEYRDINIAYSWASVPTEMYGLIPYRYIDGADVAYTTHFADSVFSAKFFTGMSEADIAYANDSEPIKIDNIIGASFTFDFSQWVFQIKHTHVKFDNETLTNEFLINIINEVPASIWPDASQYAQELSVNNKETAYSSVNAQGYLGNFILTAEVASIHSDSTTIPDLFSGYASIAYQHQAFTYYSVLAMTDGDKYSFDEEGVNPEHIPELISHIESARNFYSSNQHSLSLGMRWDLTSNVSTYLQWRHTKLAENGDTLWVNHTDETPKASVNTYMLNVSFAL